MESKHLLSAVCVIALATLETTALLKGVDGVLFAGVATAIAGIGGWRIGRRKE